MTAAAQNGIPTAFIVRDGTVQWIGHPMTMDKPLEQVVAGTWDAPAYRTTFEAKQAEVRAAQKRMTAIRKARETGDWDAILAILDADMAKATGPAKMGLQVQKFDVLLMDAKRPEPAYALGRELASEHRDNPMLLNQLAWTVLDNPKVSTRNLDFALSTAQAAVTASKGKDAAIMDTLARAHWELGDKPQAIEWQKKAIEIADEASAKQLRETLEKYEGGTPPKPGAKPAS
jgi:tetratricopeptide (TPR) repeat protein